MTATDELRRLLDERGVEWTDGGMFHRTHWVIDGIHYVAFEQSGKLYLQSSMGPLTPAQAIAATLGATDANPTQDESSGTCHAVISDNLTESEGTGDAWADCSECGHLLFVLTDPNSQVPNFCPNCGRRVVQ